jgi:hypothetical protein
MQAAFNIVLGGAAAIVAWFLMEFVGRPFRQFFDLRRDVVRRLVQFGNVMARAKMEGDRRMPVEISTEENTRLAEAEKTFRDLASQIRAFAVAEFFAAQVVKLFGFDAMEASTSLIGYSNEIGTYGQGRAGYETRIRRVLHIRAD